MTAPRRTAAKQKAKAAKPVSAAAPEESTEIVVNTEAGDSPPMPIHPVAQSNNDHLGGICKFLSSMPTVIEIAIPAGTPAYYRAVRKEIELRRHQMLFICALLKTVKVDAATKRRAHIELQTMIHELEAVPRSNPLLPNLDKLDNFASFWVATILPRLHIVCDDLNALRQAVNTTGIKTGHPSELKSMPTPPPSLPPENSTASSPTMSRKRLRGLLKWKGYSGDATRKKIHRALQEGELKSSDNGSSFDEADTDRWLESLPDYAPRKPPSVTDP